MPLLCCASPVDVFVSAFIPQHRLDSRFHLLFVRQPILSVEEIPRLFFFARINIAQEYVEPLGEVAVFFGGI
jgi:hypothetical protein